MPPRLRGKWALGITPRNFTWILKDKLAICERPGGYGDNHRRVRRQEEIIWIRENGFGCVISIIPAPHNLHNYEELGVAVPAPAVQRPTTRPLAEGVLPRAPRAARRRTKVIVHNEEVGDRIVGIMGGYIRWSGLVDDRPRRSRSPSESPDASSTRSAARSSDGPTCCELIPASTRQVTCGRMSTTPANWYPDPIGRHQLRYWDGAAWTEHVSDNGVTAIDPMTAARPRPARLRADRRQRGRPGQDPRTAHARRPPRRGRRPAPRSGGGGTLFNEPILVVNQKAKVIELNNQYSVFNQHGQQVAAVNQVGQTTAKKVMRLVSSLDQFMTHKLEITDPAGSVLCGSPGRRR